VSAVARVLLVGCGCRGLELAARLVAEGHAVRASTRDPGRLEEIEATGAEAVLADPDRLSTLIGQIDGVSVLCWLMAGVVGEPEVIAGLHGPRLESLVETLVDTHVRGVVYEAAGRVQPARLAKGAATVRRLGQTYRMPVEILEADPAEPAAWVTAAAGAVDRILAA